MSRRRRGRLVDRPRTDRGGAAGATRIVRGASCGTGAVRALGGISTSRPRRRRVPAPRNIHLGVAARTVFRARGGAGRRLGAIEVDEQGLLLQGVAAVPHTHGGARARYKSPCMMRRRRPVSSISKSPESSDDDAGRRRQRYLSGRTRKSGARLPAARRSPRRRRGVAATGIAAASPSCRSSSAPPARHGIATSKTPAAINRGWIVNARPAAVAVVPAAAVLPAAAVVAAPPSAAPVATAVAAAPAAALISAALSLKVTPARCVERDQIKFAAPRPLHSAKRPHASVQSAGAPDEAPREARAKDSSPAAVGPRHARRTGPPACAAPRSFILRPRARSRRSRRQRDGESRAAPGRAADLKQAAAAPARAALRPRCAPRPRTRDATAAASRSRRTARRGSTTKSSAR